MDIPMELSRILITELGEQQVIFLKEKGGERTFPILIGISEALAIRRRLNHEDSPRPMTHDLLANTIQALGGAIERIVINDLRDHTFIATILVRRGEDLIPIDSRPSDAIALGAAYETPIYVAEHVLRGVMQGPATARERVDLLRSHVRELKEAIEQLTRRLQDEAFISSAPPERLAEHRRRLDEMQREHDAIERILKKIKE